MFLRPVASVLCVVAAAWFVLGSCEACAQQHAADEQAGGHHDDAAAAGHGDGAGQEQPSPLVVDPDLAIWTFLVFLVLLAVLWKFAWGPIAAALDLREQKIADNIAAAEQCNEEAKKLLADYEAKLAAARDEVRGILDEARRDAETRPARRLSPRPGRTR